jgi:hypothetical protein
LAAVATFLGNTTRLVITFAKLKTLEDMVKILGEDFK